MPAVQGSPPNDATPPFGGATLRFVGLLLLMIAVFAAGSAVLVRYAGGELDALSRSRAEHVARSAVETLAADQARIALDYAWWDDAFERLVRDAAVDPEWAEQNIGKWLYDSAKIANTFVVAPDGGSRYAARAGEPQAADALALLGEDGRRLIAQALATPLDAPRTASGYMPIEGAMHLVTAAAITPQTLPEPPLDPAGRHVLVITRAIDAPLIAQLSERFVLPGLALVAPGAALPAQAVSIPLAGADGGVAARLAWTGDTLGATLTGRLLWPLLGLGCAVILLCGLLMRRHAAALRALAAANQALRGQRAEALAAKERAEFANRTKSFFLAGVSHELRTPLNAILGFSEIMKDELFGRIGQPQYREYVADIHHSAGHLLEVINEILDLSKIEAGAFTLRDEALDVAEIAAAAVRLAGAEVPAAARPRLELDLPAELPGLRADRRVLKQILINLLGNAVKFTPPDGRIVLRGWAQTDGLRLQVQDSGIGIAPENVPLVLAPFGQIDDPMTKRYRGTGLGLPLARLMTELHGGALTLESRPGHGTTVTLAFPTGRLLPRQALRQSA
ncbi:MAG TPA: ATP-binding protein [Alphaproteobacteria bacterium]|nr:ATP-binding protein [Alphaproteobacteria bacterium]